MRQILPHLLYKVRVVQAYPMVTRLLLFLLLLGSLSQSLVTAQSKSVFDLNKALQQLEQQIRTGVTIDFSLTSQSNTQPQKGYAWLCGQRFMLSMPDIEVAFDGTTLRIIKQSEGTYTLMTPTEQELLTMNPLAYIRQSSEHYRITQRNSPRGSVVYRFVPKDKGKTLSGINYYEVTFDQQSLAPKCLRLYFDLGEQISYIILKIQPKEHITSQSFTFAPQEYKSLEIVDLR